MFERFSDHARSVMVSANSAVQQFGHECIGSEHIFLGLIKVPEGKGAAILKEKGIDTEKMLKEVEELAALKGGEQVVQESKIKGTPDAIKVITYAVEEARTLGAGHIGTEHILLGLLRDSEGVAGRVLANLGVTFEFVRASLE